MLVKSPRRTKGNCSHSKKGHSMRNTLACTLHLQSRSLSSELDGGCTEARSARWFFWVDRVHLSSPQLFRPWPKPRGDSPGRPNSTSPAPALPRQHQHDFQIPAGAAPRWRGGSPSAQQALPVRQDPSHICSFPFTAQLVTKTL